MRPVAKTGSGHWLSIATRAVLALGVVEESTLPTHSGLKFGISGILVVLVVEHITTPLARLCDGQLRVRRG